MRFAIRDSRFAILYSMRKLFLVLAFFATAALAQNPPYAPDRRPGEGEGPFQRLIIRGATVIDGTGAPPIGPADIVIEGNRIREVRVAGAPLVPITAGGGDRIREVRVVGAPLVPIRAEGRPQGATKEIDGSNLYVLPGFIDMHGHAGGAEQGTTAEYVYKLWMAHGVTTVREPGCGNGADWCLH